MNRAEQLEHQRLVQDFLKKCEEQQPEKLRKVCAKYPILTARRWKTVHKREFTSGLMGVANNEENDDAK